MFRHQSDNSRQWIVNSVMVFAITLLVIGFFTGKQKNHFLQEEAEAETKHSQSKEKSLPASVRKEAAHAPMDDYGDIENVLPDQEQLHPEPVPEPLLRKEEREKSKKAALLFVEQFYPYEGTNPFLPIQKSKEIVSPALYDLLMQSPERPTNFTVKRNLLSAKAETLAVSSSNEWIWHVRVRGIATDREGNAREETDIYQVKLKRISSVYKVTDFLINYLQ